jgi:hypothetical protein
MLRASLAASVLALAVTSTVSSTGASTGTAWAATTPTPSTTPTEIFPGADVVSATLSGPGIAHPRTITPAAAAAFERSWLIDSIFGHPTVESPPATAPEYHLDIVQRYGGHNLSFTTDIALGTNEGWIGMPAQTLGWAFVSQQRWIRGRAQAMAAFTAAAGDLPNHPASAARAANTAPTGSSSGGTSVWLWIALGVVVVLVLVGGGLMLRRADRR